VSHVPETRFLRTAVGKFAKKRKAWQLCHGGGFFCQSIAFLQIPFRLFSLFICIILRTNFVESFVRKVNSIQLVRRSGGRLGQPSVGSPLLELSCREDYCTATNLFKSHLCLAGISRRRGGCIVASPGPGPCCQEWPWCAP
jgi:hypothetical protein